MQIPGDPLTEGPNDKTQLRPGYDVSLDGKKEMRFGFRPELLKTQSLNNSQKQLRTRRNALGKKSFRNVTIATAKSFPKKLQNDSLTDVLGITPSNLRKTHPLQSTVKFTPCLPKRRKNNESFSLKISVFNGFVVRSPLMLADSSSSERKTVNSAQYKTIEI